MVSSHQSMLPDENLKINISKSIQVRILRPCLFPPSFPFSCHLPSPNPLSHPHFTQKHIEHSVLELNMKGTCPVWADNTMEPTTLGMGPVMNHTFISWNQLTLCCALLTTLKLPLIPCTAPQATPALKIARENLFSRSCWKPQGQNLQDMENKLGLLHLRKLSDNPKEDTGVERERTGSRKAGKLGWRAFWNSDCSTRGCLLYFQRGGFT